MVGKVWLISILISLVFWAGLYRAFAACDFHCKVRVTACDTAARCITEDKLPDEAAGICPIMMMGVVGEWLIKHPGYHLKSAQCVLPDDQNI